MAGAPTQDERKALGGKIFSGPIRIEITGNFAVAEDPLAPFFASVSVDVVRTVDCVAGMKHDNRVSGLLILTAGEARGVMERLTEMGLVVVAIVGAGAAARAAWGLVKAYEKLGLARDELDDSLHTHDKENPNSAEKP